MSSDDTTASPPEGDLPDAREQARETAGHGGHGHKSPLLKLAISAIGVVFGDIGTSPLYAFRETFDGHHPLALDAMHIYGVVSLMFWSMMLVVTVKYVSIIMRADNKGEGGSLALLALVSRRTRTMRWSAGLVILGVFATALFYADSMITPAVSVLGAVEGIAVYNSDFAPLIVPIAVVIMIGLFLIQRTGTARVGAFFGPVMLGYFTVISVLGVLSIAQTPEILRAFSPHYAGLFFAAQPIAAFLSLGTVVLVVTGAEALYSDMGHFGRKPIGVSWLWFVLPALMMNYMGQAALLLRDVAAIESPFYLLSPEWFRLPLIAIATMAAIIASQAVISGAFSVTQQAIQLGFMPRLRIEHTSEKTAGQIYIPAINWALMVMVILLVLIFRSSGELTAAYGIAVTGAMFIDTCLLTVLLLYLWQWKLRYAIPLLSVLFLVDAAFLAANLTKIPDGGWFPLVVGGAIFTLLTTWSRGRTLMRDRMRELAMPIPIFVKSAVSSAARVPGTAVFMTSTASGVPHALLHNLKHNKVLHERVVLLTVKIADEPYLDAADRCETEDLGKGFHRLVLKYGFMEQPDVPEALSRLRRCGPPFLPMQTSFFLSRQTVRISNDASMPAWREKLFAWQLRNSESAMEFFRLPTNRVVELGSQLEI